MNWAFPPSHFRAVISHITRQNSCFIFDLRSGVISKEKSPKRDWKPFSKTSSLMVESENLSYVRTFGTQCMCHISKDGNLNPELLVTNTILLALTRIIEVKHSLNLWWDLVLVFSVKLCLLCSVLDRRGKPFVCPAAQGEGEFVPHSLQNTVSISSFRRSKILRHLPKSGDCLFTCFPASELTTLTRNH